MSKYLLFQMWEPARKRLIERHHFYLSQARSRLLGQFNDIEHDAEKAATDWLERASQRFDPDRDDDGSIHEAARDEGIAHYQLLEEMRDNVRLSVVAGMFHEWEKQLREWMVREILHWHRGSDVRNKIWAQELGGLIDLFACLGWDIRGKSYFGTLDACRLVVNVYKHGDGSSFTDLKQRCPEYIVNPFNSFDDGSLGIQFADHTNVKVTDDHIQAFSDAIIAFWTDLPNGIYDDAISKVPKWFEKAWLKDLAGAASPRA